MFSNDPKMDGQFREAFESAEFVSYEKSLTERILMQASRRWGQAEPEIVEAITGAIQFSTPSGSFSPRSGLSIETNAAFVHGPGPVGRGPTSRVCPGSQVAFQYYGDTRAQKELADLLWVASLVAGGKRTFERCTFIQFKKSKRPIGSRSWALDRKQYYLLSRFPTFRGVGRSLVPRTPHCLPNVSGTLGSFGLLFPPGDFGFLGATDCYRHLGDCRAVSDEAFVRLLSQGSRSSAEPARGFGWSTHSWMGDSRWRLASEYYGNVTRTANVYDFISSLLRMSLGEPVYSVALTMDSGVRALVQGVFEELGNYGRRTGHRDSVLLSEAYARFPLFDEADLRRRPEDSQGEDANPREPRPDAEPGVPSPGFGVAHTTIKIGE